MHGETLPCALTERDFLNKVVGLSERMGLPPSENKRASKTHRLTY